MAFSDTYIATHADKLMRLADQYAIRAVGGRSQYQEIVKVGTRRFEELVRDGYRVVNPNVGVNRETGLGIRKTVAMMIPGGSFVDEVWTEEERAARHGHGHKARNPLEGLSYTTWAAVRLMQERAKEYGEPGMVKVFPESDASHVWRAAQAVEGKMARVQAGVPRMALEVYGVVDRPRLYGYAPEKWVDEFSDRVYATETHDQHERVEASAKAAVKAWGTFVDEYNRIGRKYMEKLEDVVVKYEGAAREAIQDLRQGYGVAVERKAKVQSTGSGVLARIGNAGTTAGSALMGLARAVKTFVNVVTAVPEPTDLGEFEQYAYKPETGMRKRTSGQRKGRR